MCRRRRGHSRGRARIGLARATLGRGWDPRRPGGQHHVHDRYGNDDGSSDHDSSDHLDDGRREPAPDRRVPDVDLPAVPGGDSRLVAGRGLRLAGRGASGLLPRGRLSPTQDHRRPGVRLHGPTALQLLRRFGRRPRPARPGCRNGQLRRCQCSRAVRPLDPTGVCDNRVGYYEVANSRVVYQENGQVHSFGIASLISWRGEWYVVHLGAILRSTSQGIVEDPEIGPGQLGGLDDLLTETGDGSSCRHDDQLERRGAARDVSQSPSNPLTQAVRRRVRCLPCYPAGGSVRKVRWAGTTSADVCQHLAGCATTESGSLWRMSNSRPSE